MEKKKRKTIQELFANYTPDTEYEPEEFDWGASAGREFDWGEAIHKQDTTIQTSKKESLYE